MSNAIYVGYEIGYDREGALDYFFQDEKTEFYDKTKHKIKTTKIKDITDAEDEKIGLQDWLWKIEIFNKEVSDE
tara:strand:- start:50 stop:271 length:222 start_codon:yes stop_codon:yes gene_type:complete